MSKETWMYDSISILKLYDINLSREEKILYKEFMLCFQITVLYNTATSFPLPPSPLTSSPFPALNI